MAGLMLLSVLLLMDTSAVFGHPYSRSLIVGGNDAPEGDWKWIVALVKNSNPTTIHCGGSLIAYRWVLTAAHCLSLPTDQLSVRVGVYKLTEEQTTGKTFSIDKAIVHPEYVDVTGGNDIALLKLDRDVHVPSVGPYTFLGDDKDSYDYCVVAGWGQITENELLPPPRTLQEVDVPIVPNDICKNSYPALKSKMICAGTGRENTCFGDSGGPLMCFSNDQWKLAGIVSYEEGCGQQDKPGVYTRVSSYLDFIRNYIPNFIKNQRKKKV